MEIVCCACLRVDFEGNVSKPYENLLCKDSDGTSYFEKLKFLVSPNDLIEEELKICPPCLNLLRLSYEFKSTVESSQNSLRNRTDKAEIKVEITSKCEDHDEYSQLPENDESKAQIENSVIETEHSYGLKPDLKTDRYCEKCDKTFKRSFGYLEHMNTHTKEKSYRCDYCQKTFLRKTCHVRHLKTHLTKPGEKSRKTPFLCNVCGREFPYSNTYQRHLRVHLGIRKHECQICNRKFSQAQHLQVHMRRHTGEKPYVCDMCGASYSFRESLRKHEAAVHRPWNTYLLKIVE